MTRDLVWIKIFPDEAAAAGVREVLRANGIESVVSGERDHRTPGAPPRAPGYRLGVRAADVRAALALVWSTSGAAADSRNPGPGRPLTPP